MKFIKKPIVIEATQWFKNGDHPEDYTKDEIVVVGGEQKTVHAHYRRINNWEGDVVRYYRSPTVDGKSVCKHCGKIMHEHGWVETLEGGHIVCPGDWIITGVRGERYPCKPDIFAATYDKWCSEEDMASQSGPEGGLVDQLRKEMSEQSRLYEASKKRVKEMEALMPGAAWFIRRCIPVYQPQEWRQLAETMAQRIETSMRGLVCDPPLLAVMEAESGEIKSSKASIGLLEELVLKATEFNKCEAYTGHIPCEACDTKGLKLYYRRTCHEVDEGEHLCLRCIVKRWADFREECASSGHE